MCLYMKSCDHGYNKHMYGGYVFVGGFFNRIFIQVMNILWQALFVLLWFLAITSIWACTKYLNYSQ